jgi:hypothetical protein
MQPRIVRSDLTNQWYVVTRYMVKKNPNDSGKGILIAQTKYDVTDQINEIINEEVRIALAIHDAGKKKETDAQKAANPR